MSPAKSSSNAHVLLYPYFTSGHIIPLLDLTPHFLSRGLTVTILVTQSNKSLLNPLISSHGGPQFHPLIFPDPAPQISHSHDHVAAMRSLREKHYPLLLQWFKSHESPPVAVISDFFLGWTYELCSEVGAKRFIFSPSGALSFSVVSSLWKESPQNDENELDYTVSLHDIPNSPTFPWWQLPQSFRMGKAGDPNWEFHRRNHLANVKSDGVVFNSFADLERDYLAHVKKFFGENNVWAVGPAFSPGDALASRGGASSVPCDKVLSWLDSQEDRSVVYVCFGSHTVLTCEQIDILAEGLEKSGVRFVWSVRQPEKAAGVLPEGFEDRVGKRGFVIRGWAPQVPILRHRAVAAFLTHCGWNSLLEGLSGGVVMLTWPIGADQFTDALLLVDQLRVGIRVGEGTRRIPKSDEVSKVLVKSIMECWGEKERAQKMKEKAKNAVNGGSSYRELNALVKYLNDMWEVKN